MHVQQMMPSESLALDRQLAAASDQELYRYYGSAIRDGRQDRATRALTEIDRRGLDRLPDPR